MKVPDPEPYFTIGLYSVMDALFDLPMTAFTKELPLSEEAIQALIDHQGMMGATLRCVLSYERGDWEGINVLFLEPEVIQQAYFDALS
jgi:EAL and modified HD-GYP domain-containing signal transduction protein